MFDDILERMMKATGARTQLDLAEILGIRPGTISDAKRRGSIPSDWLVKLCRTHNLNPVYLIDGMGPSHVSPSSPQAFLPVDQMAYDNPEVHESVAQFGTPDSTGRGNEFFRNSIFDKAELIHVPIAESYVDIEDHSFIISEKTPGVIFSAEWLRAVISDPINAFLMTVSGDSMEPTFREGDVILLDIGQKRIQTGWVYALRVGGSVMIKRLELMPGNRIRVISDNRKEYPPYESDAAELDILGQIIWYCRKLVKI